MENYADFNPDCQINTTCFQCIVLKLMKIISKKEARYEELFSLSFAVFYFCRHALCQNVQMRKHEESVANFCFLIISHIKMRTGALLKLHFSICFETPPILAAKVLNMTAKEEHILYLSLYLLINIQTSVGCILLWKEVCLSCGCYWVERNNAWQLCMKKHVAGLYKR